MGIVLPRLLNYLLLTPFYTRIFQPGEYGIITELYAYVVFLLVVLTYGMETGFFRYASNSENKNEVYTSIISSVFVTSALFVFIIFLFIRPITGILGYSEYPQFIRWLAIIVALDAFTAIPFARIRLENKPTKYALIRIVEVVVNIGLNWFFLFYCERNEGSKVVQWIYNPEIGVGYVLISNLVATILKTLLLASEIGAAVKGKFSPALLRVIFRYSFPLLIAGLAGTVNEALDRVLLKHLLDDTLNPMAQLGIYGANFKIAVLMTLYVQMFKYAAEPFFFTKSTESNAKKLYADVMKFFVIPGLMIFLGVMLYIDVFKLFIGTDFREGVGIVPVILMANLIMGIFFNLSIWYKLTNKTMIGALLVTTGALITILINALFIPKYGYIASAWGHLICYTVMVVISYLFSRKHYFVAYDIKRIAIYFGVVLFFFFIDRILASMEFRYLNLLKPLMLLFSAAIFYIGEKKTFNYYRTIEKQTTINES